MKRVALLTLALLLAQTSAAPGGGELHGTVTTTDGEEFTGAIRWDKNENFWDDVLDASKTDRVQVEDREGLNLRIFGLRVVRSGGRSRGWTRSQFTIPFGHLASIEPLRGDRVNLKLKNGEDMEVIGGSDLGDSIRDIVVFGAAGDEVKLQWDEVERVDFGGNPGEGLDEERLYGTVETRIGNFTGFIVWDKDEALREDVLDGRHGNQKIGFPFGLIDEIERLSSRGSRVTLSSGEVFELEGTNDVNDENRGIDVTIEDMGRVVIGWDEFQSVSFAPPPRSHQYGEFDGGTRIHGTVTTRDRGQFTGEIVWDKDERYTWEALDGGIEDVAFEILFEHIGMIERVSGSSAKVRLRDGLEFVLRDSNDVDDGNKGILVRTQDGEEVEIGWDDFESAVFSGS